MFACIFLVALVGAQPAVEAIGAIAPTNARVVGGVVVAGLALVCLRRGRDQRLDTVTLLALVLAALVIVNTLPGVVQLTITVALGLFVLGILAFGVVSLRRSGVAWRDLGSAPRDPFPPPWLFPGLGRVAFPAIIVALIVGVAALVIATAPG